ncbi:double-stranded DNA binding protein [Providencia phage PSTRCR_127]|nr:double-stranded DNA binding protein [Providencia phage PSTRCR_127]QQV89112.1 double-stranded DNA binding protein [Providencia phage PSTRCR_121]UGO50286.1 putative dsDNA binding protein [Morganella phage vB_MmoM_Rgz1]
MKDKVEFDEAVHGEDLARMIKDASDQKTIMESYADKIKDIRNEAKEKLGVDGKKWNQVFRLYHSRTRERFEAEKDEALELYDSLFPGN